MSYSDSKETVDLDALSDQAKNEYVSERLLKFKMTITVCIIYGLIAFFLLILIIFTPWGKRLFYNDMLAFVITFIIGTIVIVLWLSNNIYNFRPKKPDDRLTYDAEMCPDFWKLKNVPSEELFDTQKRSYLTSGLNTNHFKYKCVLDDSLFDANKFIDYDRSRAPEEKKNYKTDVSNRLYVTISDKEKSGIKKDDVFDKFKEYSANISGYTYGNGIITRNNSLSVTSKIPEEFNNQNVPLACDAVYPLYLSVMDRENLKTDPSEPSNRFRCAYAKSCGIPWTEAGCV